jgi:hypothetical protein
MRPPLTLAFTRPAAIGALGELRQDVIPILLLLGLVEGENGIALLVLELLEDDLDGGADLEFAEIGEFIGGDDAFGFAADVDDDLVGADFSDDARDDGAFLQLVEGALGEQVLH